jgi:DNA-binding transcriptional MerR regulator
MQDKRTVFKIGEFSRLGQVSARMLRHYDQLGLLKPGHTDRFTSYRYYTLDQLSRLHRILALKGLGIPLEQITDLLRKDQDISAEKLRGMLLVRQAELTQDLQAKQWQLAEVNARLQQIEQEGQPLPYEVVVKPVPAQTVASVRAVVATIAEMAFYCRSLYAQLYASLERHGIEPLGTEVTLYHAEEYTETDIEVETAVLVDRRHLGKPVNDGTYTIAELPASDLTAALIYQGPFDEVTAAILALLKYVAQHDHAPAGPLRELHLSGRAHDEHGVEQEAPVIELQLPIQHTGN